jgi:hypothetical protein
MDDTTVRASAAPVAPSVIADDSGHDSGAESATMAASSPTRGAIRMEAGGGDSRTHRLLQEDDRDRRRPSGIPRLWMANR